MKITKVLIIDDEPKLSKVLKIKLERYCSDIEVVGEALNITEGYEKIKMYHPQLVFLDISMPGGSGFDLLDKYESIDFQIIFVTGFNDFVLDAMKVSAIDYLLKPVATEELKIAVEKAQIRIDEKEKAEKYQLLKYNLNHLGDQKAQIAIPGANTFVVIKNIIRCEGWQKYTHIHLTDGSRILSSYNIGVFKDMLMTYDFYSTHKSHLINQKLIVKYLKEGVVIMSDGSRVPVSRRKKDEFVEKVLTLYDIKIRK